MSQTATPEAESLAGARVLVVDDHRTFAELLMGALATKGMQPVGIAHSAAEAIRMTRSLEPDLVVMDIEMPGEDGLAATRRIRELAPTTVIAVVTAHRDAQWVVRAAQAGACAFVPKDGSLSDMIDVLCRARAGQMIVAPSAFEGGDHAAGAGCGPLPGAPQLTRREHEVLDCLGRGMPVKSIARVLGITVETCRGYVKSLHTKLDARSQLEAVVKAQHLGLLGRRDAS